MIAAVQRVVIVHDEMGVFVGAAMGFAFWSMMDTAGQHTAVTFEGETDAREFVAEWVPAQDPDAYRYVPVQTATDWATVIDLTRAGLSEYTALMLFNTPAVGDVC